jgi:hypothetical protein
MSEETLKIVVPFFTAILGLFIGFFLNQALYERKRRDELSDREFNRRSSFRDVRTEEAKDYINTYIDACRMLSRFEIAIIVFKDIEKYEQDFDKILELLNSTPKKSVGIYHFQDLELNNLDNELIALFKTECNNAVEIRGRIEENEIFDEEAALNRVHEFSSKTGRILGGMQARLEILAQTSL